MNLATFALNNTFVYQSDYFRPHSSICSVKYQSRYGTGFIVGFEYPESTWRTLFITSYQIAPLNDPCEVTGLKVMFEDTSVENISFTPNYVRTLWTSPVDELDVTVIELSTIAITIVSRTNISRLLSTAPQNKEKVSIFNYGTVKSELNICVGLIDNIDGNLIEYSALKSTISPGSPILNADFKIIGIESKVGVGQNKWKAVIMNKIFGAYQNELQKLYGNKTENEIWLQRINDIEQNKITLIGCGGFGKVYKIEDSNGNIFALKIVEGFGGLEAFQNQTTALNKEYRLVTSLELHPRIIQFFGFVRDDFKARLIIIMEYLEGGSLLNKIKTRGKIDRRNSLKYLIQILEGIAFLHKKSIYHSDIKPANILLTEKENIKICDFGIAVQFSTESSITSSNLKGACYYMSPERINGNCRSAENDIWSVGATFVTMITGNTINSNEKDLYPQIKIANYQVFIEGKLLEEYLNELDENDYRRQIISITLCEMNKRARAAELLEICKRLNSDLLNIEYVICYTYSGNSRNNRWSRDTIPNATFSNFNSVTNIYTMPIMLTSQGARDGQPFGILNA